MKAAEKRAQAEAAKKAKEAEGGAQVEEITDEEAQRLMKKEEPSSTVAKVEEKEEAKKEGEEDEKDKGAKPNAGNGGETDTYTWEQTLSEITCNVQLPPNIMGKHLSVNMGIKTCKIQIKGGEMLMEGEWCEPIIQDDSLWCIETINDKRVLQLNITKKNQMGWWNCMIKGHAQIDT